jgi:hypothetical protein
MRVVFGSDGSKPSRRATLSIRWDTKITEPKSRRLGRRLENIEAGSTRSKTVYEGVLEVGDVIAGSDFITGFCPLTICFSEFH